MTVAEDDVVSWLLLERYALGELDALTTARVEAALARDARTRACLEMIRRPLELPELIPLRAAPAAMAPRVARVWPALATLAAAAAVLLLVRGMNDPDSSPGNVPAPPHEPAHRIKGSAVALSIVREHHGQIIANATSFAEGDRLKVLLTCPDSANGPFQILVQQGSSVSSPLEVPADFACGNGVAVPGAFTLTENTPARVCVVWGERGNAAIAAPIVPGDETVCVPLAPATDVPADGSP